MAEIPLYKQKIAPTTQIGSAPADASSAAAPFKALSQLGGTVSKIGFELQERMDKEETDAQTASYMADRKVRTNAMESELSIMKDPDEIEEFYTQWRADEQNILNESRLNKNSRSFIANNYEDFYATADIGASQYYRKAKISSFDRGYIDAQNLALNNETDPTLTNPNTGRAYTPSEFYEYATMKRVDIGTVDYEDAIGDIRNFDQVVEYRNISKVARINPDEAKGMLDDSSQSPQNRALLEKSIQDGVQIRDRKIVSIQSDTSSKLSKMLGQRNLTRTQVDIAMQEEQNIMGTIAPSLIKEEGNALIASLDAQEISDMEIVSGAFDDIADGYKSMFKQSGKDKWDEKGFKKVMSAIGAKKKGSARPLLSKGTIESQLNFAQNNLYKVAEGMGLNSETTDALIGIVDTFATINNDSPLNTRENIKALDSSVTSFMEGVKESGGNMNSAQIDEWQKDNLSKQIRETAIINARNTYRVGEPVRPSTTPATGIILPTDEEGPVSYRYIGNGEFEVID